MALKFLDPSGKLYYHADKDQDGLLSQAEWKAFYLGFQDPSAPEETLSKLFKTVDADQNDSISFEEFKGQLEKRKEEQVALNEKLGDAEYKRFYEGDRSDPKDEVLDYGEWNRLYKLAYPLSDRAFTNEVFTEADSDESGTLSFAEFKIALTKAQEKIAAIPKDPILAIFDQVDTSKDKRVQFDEWKAMYQEKKSEASDEFMTGVFKNSDLDNNEALIFDEFKYSLLQAAALWAKTPQGKLEILFDKANTNTDEGVSFEEWKTIYK